MPPDQGPLEVELPDGTIAEFPAGMTDEQITAALKTYTPSKSVGGFLGNVVSSTGNQLGNLVQAITSPVQTAKGVGSVIRGGVEKLIPGEQGYEQYADAFGQQYKDRYGSLGQLAETAYSDPAGVAMDVATLAGGVGGGLRVLGKAASLPTVAKAGQALGAVEAATSPTRLVTLPAKAALRELGIGAIRPTTKPSNFTQTSFNVTPRQVAKTVMDKGLVTEKSATRAYGQAEKAVDQALTKAEAAGETVHAGKIARGVRAKVQPEIDKRVRATGAPDVTADLTTRLRDFRAAHPGLQIKPLEANELKRVAQKLAYESNKAGNTIGQLTDEAFARLYKDALEQLDPAVGPANRQAQLAIAAEQSIRDAASRSSDIPKFVGAAQFDDLFTDPVNAIKAYTIARMATAPMTGRVMGTGLGMTGKGIDSALLRRMAMQRMLSEAGTPETP